MAALPILRYELNNPPVISETIDGEVVAIDLDAGTYFSLRGPAAALWGLLLTGAAPPEIVARAVDASDRATLAESLDLFVQRLLADRLLRPRSAQNGGAEVVPALPAWTDADLAYESFTDMQNLLGLDPIHEADERLGWPVQPS
ncbi:MAG: PqqD family protein [Rhodospirillaceae bacterium]|nr:PqqD family protein [Rhodospirillaceae bacterium]